MRGLILAIQFLTRLPTPALADFRSEELARSVTWFPLVGLLVGLAVAAGVWLGSRFDPWLGAVFGLAAWVAITGALHLDGLADLADALGASHRNPERLLAVLADPHVGVFGMVAVVMQLLAKLALLMLAARLELFGLLVLIPAWARLGVLAWSRLPALKPGLGERYAWHAGVWMAWGWGVLLSAASLVSPVLLLAPLAILVWYLFLKVRLGGMTGDALGAGVEVTECLLLVVGVMVGLA
jgi:adenosylcobinamide-GDP ribazoletransferase